MERARSEGGAAPDGSTSTTRFSTLRLPLGLVGVERAWRPCSAFMRVRRIVLSRCDVARWCSLRLDSPTTGTKRAEAVLEWLNMWWRRDASRISTYAQQVIEAVRIGASFLI